MFTHPLIGRLAALTGLVALTTFGAPAPATAQLALFADQKISVAGSKNEFCGRAHSNGTVRLTGNDNLVSGVVGHVGSFRSNAHCSARAEQTAPAPVPAPAHDLAYYRSLAQASGTYFAGNADLDDVRGLVFAEGDIHLSGSKASATVTFVSARGGIKLSGSHNALLPAVDGMLLYAAGGDIDLSGSNSTFDGSMYAPAGSFTRRGADNSTAGGPVVARTIAVSGARNHVGGECCVDTSDCTPTDTCTSATCSVDGVCAYDAIAGCTPCTTAADCPAAGECSTAVCTNGICSTLAIADCRVCAPEFCTDGADNDCDGLADCADSDCTVACTPPPPPVEVCGDCRDNDGDGLTDAQDPDCCASAMPFGAKVVQMKPLARRGDRLRLIGVFAPNKPAGFNPRTQDTSVQITDDQGALFCSTITANHWMSMGKRTVTFWDKKGAYSNGLSDGRFKLMKNGNVVFRTHGRKVKLRTPMARRVQITVRVGDMCSQTTTSLRTTRHGLALP